MPPGFPLPVAAKERKMEKDMNSEIYYFRNLAQMQSKKKRGQDAQPGPGMPLKAVDEIYFFGAEFLPELFT